MSRLHEEIHRPRGIYSTTMYNLYVPCPTSINSVQLPAMRYTWCSIKNCTKFTRHNIAAVHHSRAVFTAQCTIVHSAVLRNFACRPSVCLSVCPSVTLVDQDHTGWKSWKLIAWTISPAPLLFVAQRPSTYSQGNMGKFGGD